MAFPNSAVSDIIATTIQSRTGQIADNVTKNNALLARLKQRGNVKPFCGGNVILQELSFAENAQRRLLQRLRNPAGRRVRRHQRGPVRHQAGCLPGHHLRPGTAAERWQGADHRPARVPHERRRIDDGEPDRRWHLLRRHRLRRQGDHRPEGAGPINPTTGTVGGIDRATWNFWRSRPSTLPPTVVRRPPLRTSRP